MGHRGKSLPILSTFVHMNTGIRCAGDRAALSESLPRPRSAVGVAIPRISASSCHATIEMRENLRAALRRRESSGRAMSLCRRPEVPRAQIAPLSTAFELKETR